MAYHKLAKQLWILFSTNRYPVKVGLIIPHSWYWYTGLVGYSAKFIIARGHKQTNPEQDQNV
ncbi:MAG: hypothetical protein DME25_04675 [Verrucomicrobia bacterium]|nr:MAG: hypothetical protein DME25_04675 [Verrucomicrobiota bacterium]